MGFLNAGATFSSAIQSIIGLINMLVSVLGALALVVFFWGLVRYIKDSADAKGHAEGRERIIWSLVALFILFSIWGILALMSFAFFGSSNLNGSIYTGNGAGQPLNTSSSNNNSVPSFDTNFGGTAQPTPTPSDRINFTPQ